MIYAQFSQKYAAIMVHPYIVNTLNALVLIVTGIILYILNPAHPITALVPPLLGVLLLAATYHLRKHNRFVFHTVTALTLFAGVVFLAQINTTTFEWNQETTLLTVMGVSCFIAVAFYVGTFIKERRLRNNTIFKDDL